MADVILRVPKSSEETDCGQVHKRRLFSLPVLNSEESILCFYLWAVVIIWLIQESKVHFILPDEIHCYRDEIDAELQNGRPKLRGVYAAYAKEGTEQSQVHYNSITF